MSELPRTEASEWRKALAAAHAAGIAEGMGQAAKIADERAEKWRKEAQKHHRPGGRFSDCAGRDLARSRTCDELSAAIRARANTGGENNG